MEEVTRGEGLGAREEGPAVPLASLQRIGVADANLLLATWGHRIGPIRRPMGLLGAHALMVGRDAVAVAVTATTVCGTVAGLPGPARGRVVELARLCASGPHWCRPMLRLWREVVLPTVAPGCVALSYQDALLHAGEIYRHDGWMRVAYSHSGRDRRSGRSGRDKWVWVWPRDAVTRLRAAEAQS
jgi:hypothetical protein